MASSEESTGLPQRAQELLHQEVDLPLGLDHLVQLLHQLHLLDLGIHGLELVHDRGLEALERLQVKLTDRGESFYQERMKKLMKELTDAGEPVD